MRRWLKVAVALFLAGAAVLLLLAWFAYRASQHVPDFYRQAIAAGFSGREEAGDGLERRLLQLHNEARQEGRWRTALTDKQINGWLAADLPRKFPKTLPRYLQDPRVAIAADGVRVGCRYQDGRFSAVASVEVEVHLTDQPNVVALRIRTARLGALPLPLKGFLDSVQEAARQADLTLRWVQQDGDPVALVTAPSADAADKRRTVRLEAVELRSGEIVLAGRTSD